MNRLFRRPWVIATILALGVLIAGCILGFRSDNGPAVMVVSAPHRLPTPNGPWLNRVVPYSWGWFWRFKQAVFGSPRAVNLEAAIIRFPPNGVVTRSNLDLGEPTYVATNGIKLWVLAETDLNQVRRACLKVIGTEFLAQPRISTADAIGASLFAGEVLVLSGVTNSVGVSFDCYPRVHRGVTDLTTTLLVSEALTNGSSVTLQTNLELAARVQLQRGNGFFLLDQSNGTNSKSIGVFVSAKVPAKK
jgi:hypothetical protein